VCVPPHVVTLLQLKPIIIENSYFFPPFCDESSLFANQVEEKFEMHFWKFVECMSALGTQNNDISTALQIILLQQR